MVLVLEEVGGGGCTVGVTGGVQEEYRKGTEGCRRGKEGVHLGNRRVRGRVQERYRIKDNQVFSNFSVM